MRVCIVGSGMAGVGVAEELLKVAPTTEVFLFTSDREGYYSRPLLSHGFSRTDIETRIILKKFDSLQRPGLSCFSGCEVQSIEPKEQRIRFRQDGKTTEQSYDKLVLATGSEAAIPAAWNPYRAHFRVLNSLADLMELRRHRGEMMSRGSQVHWAVVGGGLIGCEVASDLVKAGDRVTLYHVVDRLMERQLSVEASARLLAHLREMGIEVRLNCEVSAFGTDEKRSWLEMAKERHEYDGVLVATGFRPRIELAKAAGLTTDRGIVTDAYLRTSDPHIYAVGDVAQVRGEALYAFVLPVRNQAVWLAKHLVGQVGEPWVPPVFKPMAKIHGFKMD